MLARVRRRWLLRRERSRNATMRPRDAFSGPPQVSEDHVKREDCNQSPQTDRVTNHEMLISIRDATAFTLLTSPNYVVRSGRSISGKNAVSKPSNGR